MFDDQAMLTSQEIKSALTQEDQQRNVIRAYVVSTRNSLSRAGYPDLVPLLRIPDSIQWNNQGTAKKSNVG